jgi:hypothetical protein
LLNSRGIVVCGEEVEHTLLPSTALPPQLDVQALVMQMQRGMPFEFFDPADTGTQTTVMQSTAVGPRCV